jgi:hypothetical protein
VGHKLPKKEPKVSNPEWKPCVTAQNLWDNLDQSTIDFQQAYGLLRGVLRYIQIHYGREEPRKRKTSKGPSTTN